MTAFSKKEVAESKKSVGKAQIANSRHKRGMLGGKFSNASLLKSASDGVKNLLAGTIEANKIKQREKNQSTDSNN